ncbi:MAG: DEAD/DEAH box helicase [archaeon]|nr:DEAD/DEAH box helicase [archaeon]
MTKFKLLQLSEGISNVIRDAGFTVPSEIQEKTIPLVLAGKDVIGSSATGSGKTLAFGAGIIDKMNRGFGVQTLILTPTRELAEQVAKTLQKFSNYKGLRIQEIYGGVSMGPQIHGLRNADIVVGTPGRILDHLERRTFRLNHIKYLVLDEADRMLDMGFIRDVEKIIRQCPNERQTLLFSATISQEIGHIAKRYMKNPVHVSVNDQIDPSQLYQKYYDVPQELKFSLLVYLLKLEKKGVVMVFCNTRRNVDRVTRGLYQYGIDALAIHGGLSQNRRTNTLQAFHSRETLILVCTDVAARGLDIKDVSHIYNFDLPNTGNDYIHRIGRTARAGKNGIAISFVSSGEHSEFRNICREKSLNIENIIVPKSIDVLSVTIGAPSRGRMGGRKGGGKQNRGHHRGNNNFRANDRNKGRFDRRGGMREGRSRRR